MSVLPLVDALILCGWSSLLVAFSLKAIYITTHYRPMLFGMRPSDYLEVAVVFLLMAVAVAARTWMKAHEPAMLARRRRALRFEADGGIDELEGGLAYEEERPVRRPPHGAPARANPSGTTARI